MLFTTKDSSTTTTIGSSTTSDNDETTSCSSFSTTSTTSKTEPFYGSPRPEKTVAGQSDNIKDRLMIALHSSITAFNDPTRADAVAALGEITGTVTLQRIYQKMMNDPVGQLILKERPIVSKTTIPYQQLIDNAPVDAEDVVTFGHAYGQFLKVHGFDPDERDEVKYVEDENLSYIILRYRQCHDFWHAITGLPPTVLGELGLKWLELFQTGLPVAALSCTVGSLRLSNEERTILLDSYLPWAIEMSSSRNNSMLFLDECIL